MAGSHHFVHLVMKLSAEAVRTRMPSAASPHHRIVFGKTGNWVEGAARLASSPAQDWPGTGAGEARPGDLAGGSSPLFTTQSQKRSGDVVRTRMNRGVSPLRAPTLITG